MPFPVSVTLTKTLVLSLVITIFWTWDSSVGIATVLFSCAHDRGIGSRCQAEVGDFYLLHKNLFAGPGGRSPAEILGSNPTGGMDVCLLWVSCVVRQMSLRRADHSSRGVLPTVVRRCVWSRNLVNEEALAQWGLSCQKQTNKQRPNYFWDPLRYVFSEFRKCIFPV
jgi:hypothetical protein